MSSPRPFDVWLPAMVANHMAPPSENLILQLPLVLKLLFINNMVCHTWPHTDQKPNSSYHTDLPTLSLYNNDYL